MSTPLTHLSGVSFWAKVVSRVEYISTLRSYIVRYPQHFEWVRKWESDIAQILNGKEVSDA